MAAPTLAAGAIPASMSSELSEANYVRRRNLAFGAVLLGVLGLFTIYSTAATLVGMWQADALKSIGAVVPVVSIFLILRAWRSLDWELQGTWWGLAVLVPTIVLVHLRDRAVLELVLTPSSTIIVPPHSLVAFAYTAGVVLLFGGLQLFRKALFPILLTLLVNPIPHAFNVLIDLPLQHAAAYVARSFAIALGQKLSPDQLRLMFTPDFGMFIAPGCDGIRGAVTMGLLALIAGYVYQFRLVKHVLFVTGAVLLGYVFNFVRLCVLILYYIVALHIPWFQSRAKMGDYIIGACLFFLATLLVCTVIRRWSSTGELRIPRLPQHENVCSTGVPRMAVWRTVAFAIVIAFGSFTYVRALEQNYVHPLPASDPSKLALFPKQIGNFTLKREWNEYLLHGPVIFYWAEYAPLIGNESVSVGVSPVLGAHDTLICHAARGEDWLWHGDLEFATLDTPTHFGGSLYNTGETQYVEITTICNGDACGQFNSNRKHFGFSYSRPDTSALLTPSPSRPIPIMLRSSTTKISMAADDARSELTANLRDFLSNARLSDFTRPYR